MPLSEINTDPIYSEQVANYLAAADRRIIYGFRACLELLKIELPSAALRRPAGRRIAGIMDDYDADNPVEAVRDRYRKIEQGHALSVAAMKDRFNR